MPLETFRAKRTKGETNEEVIVNLIEIFFREETQFPGMEREPAVPRLPESPILVLPIQLLLLQLLRGCQTLRGRSSRFKIAAVVAAHKSFLGLVDDSDFNFTYFITITD